MSLYTVRIPVRYTPIIAPIQAQSGAEPNVRVDVRTRIVQVRVEDSRVGRVVPVATANREPL